MQHRVTTNTSREAQITDGGLLNVSTVKPAEFDKQNLKTRNTSEFHIVDQTTIKSATFSSV
jgi:hypothetical protein